MQRKSLLGEYGRMDGRFAGICLPLLNVTTFVDALEGNRAWDARVCPVTDMVL